MAPAKQAQRRQGGRTRPATPQKPSRTPWVLAGVAVAALALIVATLARNGSTSGDGADAVEGIAHVHGLGVNPADGTLHVATHYGLFRIPEDGRAERVGTAVQDLMGFSVVGADHFLASGHPDPADKRLRKPGRPPLLGLIESTDGGRSWRSVSLLGEADFHSLVAAHDRVYGYDSTGGRFMVSDDGTRWETRAELPLGDFAVDPADPDHLVAMTGQGLGESRDGGRSWSSIAGPQLAFLAWHEAHGLWGVDPGGRTYRRSSGGWEPRGALPGRPQALLLTDRGPLAAADDDGTTGIYLSSDGGRTWTLRYADGAR